MVEQEDHGSNLRRIRWLLGMGFGGLLALMVLVNAYSVKVLQEVDEIDDGGTNEFLAKSDQLNLLRLNAGLTASRVRDAVLDPKSSDRKREGEAARAAAADTLVALDHLRKLANPAEAKLLDEFDSRFTSYWEYASVAVENAMTMGRTGSYNIFAEQLAPGREGFMHPLDDLRRRMESDLRAADKTASQLILTLRQRVSMTILLATVLAAVLAFLTVFYLMRLERLAARRYLEAQEGKAALGQLSARLVDVQEEERRSLARELHDEVGQSLSALLVDLGEAQHYSPPHIKPLHTALESVKNLAETTISNIRNIMLLLRPSMLDDLGLMPALHWQARETTRTSSVRVQVLADNDDLELPDSHRTAVYRIVQEALRNVTRHSGATMAVVSVRCTDTGVVVEVKDDGRGFDANANKGVGLLGMKERVDHLDGSFRITSQPGQGTLIRVELPLPVEAQSSAG
ncbi:sensor histidine kinase [Paludibaculum fermentans]|uniref:sensor histidine kinase n=1 Tax=Paludibaculum fermentans TaxID=1473598 RepID=UPI003EBEF017